MPDTETTYQTIDYLIRLFDDKSDEYRKCCELGGYGSEKAKRLYEEVQKLLNECTYVVESIRAYFANGGSD